MVQREKRCIINRYKIQDREGMTKRVSWKLSIHITRTKTSAKLSWSRMHSGRNIPQRDMDSVGFLCVCFYLFLFFIGRRSCPENSWARFQAYEIPDEDVLRIRWVPPQKANKLATLQVGIWGWAWSLRRGTEVWEGRSLPVRTLGLK